MARPKLGETETERMQLKITKAEIDAIDDWRYANKIPSRSQAVRRLCQIGIEFYDDLFMVMEHSDKLVEISRDNWLEDLRLVNENRNHTSEKLRESLEYNETISREIFDRAERLGLFLATILNRVAPYAQVRNFAAATRASTVAKKQADDLYELWLRKDREQQENQLMVDILKSQTQEDAAAYDVLSEEEKDRWWEERFMKELGPRDWEVDE